MFILKVFVSCRRPRVKHRDVHFHIAFGPHLFSRLRFQRVLLPRLQLLLLRYTLHLPFIFALNHFKGQIKLGMLFMMFVALFLDKGAFNWIIASYGSIADLESMKKTAQMPATAMIVETMVLTEQKQN